MTQPSYPRLSIMILLLQVFQAHFEGKLLFYIAIAFSVFQVVTAAHLLDLPSQILRAVHVGFLGLLALPLVCALKKKNKFLKIISWIGGLLSLFSCNLSNMFSMTLLLIRTSDLLLIDIVFGVTAVILVFIAAWLVMGYALIINRRNFFTYIVFLATI